MKKILFILVATGAISLTACKKSDFADSYANPSSVANSNVEKQFAGFLASNRWYVLPDYWNYFVVLRTTLNHYNQAVGWANSANQYVPGAASITDRWNNYYNFLAQFRELENIYAKLPEDDQKDRRIFMIAATIYLYDHTQKVVDLHGDIPWSEAGKMSANGGDYANSLPKYDKADAIYTKMLDDLKGFADELNTISIKNPIQEGFKNQDFVNNGDLAIWKKYCNSLRLRMLARVSGVTAFQSRVATETAAILGDPNKYPLITDNADNVLINVYNLNSEIHSKNFRTGLEDWDGNIAGKAMIDHMKTNSDPRLRAIFEPGANAGGVYNGLDPMLNSSTQTSLIAGGTMSIYNRSTLSRNQYFPGVLITAAEVSYLVAEAYLRAGNDAAAKTAYNKGIAQSTEFYYWLRTLSNDNVSGTLAPTNATEIAAYVASPGVKWENATTTAEKLKLLATQKWIHFNVVQPVESWAEIRRFDAPVFNFEVDNANAQKQPPYRWLYATAEQTYNTANYSTVKAQDNLTTKIFWDTK
ncbi:SusD/RagB family nutrient-binding outer membrane lipoprotein [Chitinophagaceae bacterium LB-8]|uniref:SusD/RagB family nutrient-binding outer membrane lipoprotein n=1 Tax=Paraflavisolibacter caeni TaxID=2982496 RepID=A0A9X3BHG7_9BACT|nr:SusD/RagB family nutrient-binding outer membrane lipoprotein [Paraflavisolibacter caeni]MCU7548783.1 SusD/RagB family nutrient-binding outer membrane lipoprotein [Paraflavisolibacter caeni]